MSNSIKILQIVPRAPGKLGDGVGDYATTLSQKLREKFGHETVFGTPPDLPTESFDHVILHYVNYGYQARGVPMKLLSILRKLHGNVRGRFLTVFHELYASAPPWQSAFWLRPLQKKIARSIAELSDSCIVSNDVAAEQLRALAPSVRLSVHPVPSNFGEPLLQSDETAKRDPHRWVICGGTASIQRSLGSFRAMFDRLPESFSPRELFVLGGTDNAAIRSLVVDLAAVRVDYRPQIDVAAASQILSGCSFAWLDYFHRRDVPSSVVLKSSAFSAYSAHGILSVFPHRVSSIATNGDKLPGPFFVDPQQSQFPANDADRAIAANQTYEWYRRHAASDILAKGIASALD